MRRYLLISLLSTFITIIVVLSVFSPNLLPSLTSTIYNSFKPQEKVESPQYDENGLAITKDYERENLKTLEKNLEPQTINELNFNIPVGWAFSKPQNLKTGTSLEFVSPLNNRATLTYFSIKEIDPNNFDFEKYNVTKELINSLFTIDTYYSYDSSVHKDSKMLLYTILEKEPVNLIKVWFKEINVSAQTPQNLRQYSPINTVVYVNSNDMYILNTRFSDDINNVDNYKELSELTLFIESLDLKK